MQKKRLNVITAAVFALFIIFSATFGTAANAASVGDFSDISSGQWYYESVSYVVSKGLYNGVSETKFSPNSNMTRAMFVTVLGRMAGVSPEKWCAGTVTGDSVRLRSGAGTGYSVVGSFSEGDSVTITGVSGNWYAVKSGTLSGYVSADYVSPKYHTFSDVPYGQYYSGYVIWAYEKGYISGVSETSFQPNANITREQVCKILSGYASGNGYTIEKTQTEISFSDAAAIHEWARSAVKTMQTGGIVNGYSDGSFGPTNNATRAEVAKMLYTFIQSTSASVEENAYGITPVSISDKTVSLPFERIRVALYASTKGLNTQVSSVSFENMNGSGFEYGSLEEDRSFKAEGEISQQSIVITTNGSEFTVCDSEGNILYSKECSALAIHPLSDTKAKTKVNDGYVYYGDFNCLSAYADASKITLVNYLAIDDYVKGVVPCEFPSSWPADTLKAGAIAVRSYAIAYAKSSAYTDYGFDLTATSACQLYQGRQSGSDNSFSNTDSAVDATSNMYLTYDGKVCYCMYSASNGGHMEASSGYKYLVSKDDPFDAEIGRALSGHGVGLSQWGAYAMAKYHSMSYRTILGFYYPGTSIRYGA